MWWQTYGLLVVLGVAALICWLDARWWRGNEAQHLLDKFRLPYRPREKAPEEMTLADVEARIVRLTSPPPAAASGVFQRLAKKLRR